MAKTSPQMPARLAQSAFTMFSRHGIANVSLDQVASHAGVTKGSVYWHFKSKDELIKAACVHYYRNTHRQMNAEIAPVRDPLKRLERALRRSVRICLLDEENRVFTMDIWSLSLRDPEVRRGWGQFYDSVREFYMGLVQAASLSGQMKIDDPERAVNLMLEAIEGIKLRAMFEPQICSPREESEIVKSLMEILGCGKPVAKAA